MVCLLGYSCPVPNFCAGTDPLPEYPAITPHILFCLLPTTGKDGRITKLEENACLLCGENLDYHWTATKNPDERHDSDTHTTSTTHATVAVAFKG